MLGIPNPIEDEEFEPLEVEEEEARMKHFKIHDDVMIQKINEGEH